MDANLFQIIYKMTLYNIIHHTFDLIRKVYLSLFNKNTKKYKMYVHFSFPIWNLKKYVNIYEDILCSKWM